MERKAAFARMMNVYRFVLEINKNNNDSYKYYAVGLYSNAIRDMENF